MYQTLKQFFRSLSLDCFDYIGSICTCYKVKYRYIAIFIWQWMVLSLSLSEWVWYTSLSARLKCIQNVLTDVAKAPPFCCLPVWANAFPPLGWGRAEAEERGGNCQVSFNSAEGWFFLLHLFTPTACFFYPLSRERQDQDFWWRTGHRRLCNNF